MSQHPSPILLPEAIAAPRTELCGPEGWRLAYYADRSHPGRPLLLVHSINAAASSFEMRPLFEHYRSQRPVYSLDLPGFGHSERRAADYGPPLYAQAIAELLTQVIQAPADLIALSLGCEFVARAARLVPDLIASLVLISPTGFDAKPLPATNPLGPILAHQSLGRWLFRLIASRPSIRHFLARSFVGSVPEAMVEYAWFTARQPGAEHAPFAFLAGRLFTPDAIDLLYDRLTEQPVLVIADRDPYIGFERLPSFIVRHDNWHRVTLEPHRGLPHWERLRATIEVLDEFWAHPPFTGTASRHLLFGSS
ncbi:alpha/beta fold hydrolase [Caldichromatium japonicum]|uniref:Alpha/beta fold hydrolase n=1 Tax=Caldichromatium japonicum TaxID=2699430 RepID=A0A6G7VD71_9GAMM|nr:alpha/beta fold hydrolase [Caldichromatium japonicum]QIK37737.1 alpha/beta fold hydrolase [Caldichromatium japonicum]